MIQQEKTGRKRKELASLPGWYGYESCQPDSYLFTRVMNPGAQDRGLGFRPGSGYSSRRVVLL